MVVQVPVHESSFINVSDAVPTETVDWMEAGAVWRAGPRRHGNRVETKPARLGSRFSRLV
jgi:hypothetical protein